MKQTKLNIISALLLVAAMTFGTNVWATTKTVTYTITQIETMGDDKEVTFTRSGDDPFDASATTYTCTIPQSALYPQTGAGNINLTLADGFSMTFQWGTGSNVMFNNNNYCIFPYDSQNTGKKITYTVSCSDAYYYVTHVMMTGMESNFHHGMQQTYPGSGSIDTDYDSEWNFSKTYYSQASFGQITLTYTDVPLISIFESVGENAYKIQDKHDLRHLANYVNNGHNDCNSLTFLQTTNITCDNTYMPIGYINGSDEARFCGTYDGQGHTISGITVSRTGTGEADGYVGIFGYIYYNSSTDYGTVRNIVLANSTFTGNFYVGGIVGYNWGGTIENCRVESTVIINAGHNGARYHGGIVGKNEDPNAKVIGCYSAAVVSKNNMTSCLYHGGIVGFNNKGTVQNCLYAGTTVTAYNMKGTIIGYDENGNGTFTNNYYTAINLGGVGANGSSSDQDGARRARTVTLGENVVIVGDETTYNVSGLTAIGTGNYALHSGNILYSGATQTLTLGYTAAIPDDFTFDGYSVKDADNLDVTVTENNGTYTFVMPDKNVTVTAILTDVWGIAGGADGSEAHPYLITTTAGLDLLATEVNNGNGFSGIYFKLGNDIAYDPNNLTIDNNGDGTNDSNYTAIGGNTRSFRGIFDGDGYAVSGINVNTSGNYQGLFGHVNDGGTVKNVTLRSSSITGKNNVGGIVGYAGNATVSNNIALGTNVSAYVDKGAIVGRIDSTPGLNYTLTHNYYHDCTVGNATTNVGTNVGDVTANDGAVQVFSLS